MKKFIYIVVLIIFGLSFNKQSREKPNIILIVADDLGWTDLSYMGSKYYETPNIDKLSQSGITFFNGYASSANCAPSRATMMSGKYHPSHGIYTVSPSARGLDITRKIIPVKNTENLDLEFFTIAEMLKNEGYINAHVGKWHLGEKGNYPMDQGFDVNIGGWESGGPKGGYFSPYSNPNLENGPEGEYLTDRLTNEAINFIDNNKEERFFLHLAYYSVHTPIQSKREYSNYFKNKSSDENHNRPDYAGMIRSLDENIGKVLAKIEELNLSEETLIIFTSDNGGIRSISNQNPLRAGKGSYYEGGIRVPMIFSWKGKLETNKKSFERISNIDFYPTIKNIIGHKNKNLKLDGLDLNPIFRGKKLKERALFFHFPVYLEAYNVQKDDGKDPLFRTRPGSVIIKGDWKLHHYFEDNELELYNLSDDMSESKNLSKINKEITTRLYNDLDVWRTSNNAPIPSDKNPKYNQKFVDSLIILIKEKKISGRLNKNLLPIN
ncbi:MAG: sulfatase [Bacteroidota bacterium]|nr:sulfatase [Bacteroidota bacterium]MEC8601870.1 sulfatase [Bacteroidota bacterium]